MPVLDRLDPELDAVVRNTPVIDLSDLPKARGALLEVFRKFAAAPPDPTVERADHFAPGHGDNPKARFRAFRPRNSIAPLPALIWVQGGGYVLTSPDLDDPWCERIARDVGCAVFSVDWRRAPEHQFPAAIEDCYAVAKWVYENASQLGVNSHQLIIGGASSGGGATAALALLIRDRAEFKVAHQLLIYPMLDDANTTPSSLRVTDPQLWNRTSNQIAWKAYVGNEAGTDTVSPYAAPARAKDLAGLAPATILTAELDLFVDENLIYAQRLLAAGVPMELHVYPAAHHGFDRHAPDAAVSRRLYADRDDALRRAFMRASIN